MRKYGRVDDNQKSIVSSLRKCGAFVQSLASVGNGTPDILVAYRGKWMVCEIKDGSKPPSKRRLTEDEAQWHERARSIGHAPVCIIESVEEAIAMLNVLAK